MRIGKHGVNPTIPVCFWCGKDKNEIALMGRVVDKQTKEEVQMPMHAVLDYEPCEECKASMAQGITFMEATEDRNPTGRWCVLKEDAVVHMIEEPMLEGILKHRKAYIDTATFNYFTGGAQ